MRKENGRRLPHFIESGNRQVDRASLLPVLLPEQARGMTVEFPLLDMMQLARTDPVTLVVAHEQVPL